jgi:murein DD-endopeptidase MepM/ murein hydrolase activator NlpD
MILDCTESGWKATYMHLFDINVQYGMLIERGAVIGWIDNTGNSTGPHLHYQINGPGVGAIDPAPAMCELFHGLLIPGGGNARYADYEP